MNGIIFSNEGCKNLELLFIGLTITLLKNIHAKTECAKDSSSDLQDEWKLEYKESVRSRI